MTLHTQKLMYMTLYRTFYTHKFMYSIPYIIHTQTHVHLIPNSTLTRHKLIYIIPTQTLVHNIIHTQTHVHDIILCLIHPQTYV